MNRLCLALLVALSLASSALAQQSPNKDNGFSPVRAFHVGDIDSINALNGNLVIAIPIGQEYKAGAGLSYRLTLVYNSNLWEYESPNQTSQQVLPGRLFNAGFGWTLSLGRLLPPNSASNRTFDWIYAAADGSQHTFQDRLHPTTAETVVGNVRYSRDGSYLRLNTSTRVLEFPDGTQHQFFADGHLQQITDRFQNFLLVNRNGAVWTLSDSQGRSHKITFHTGAPYYSTYGGVVDKVELQTFGSSTPNAVYDFVYTNQFVRVGCKNDVAPWRHTLPLLTTIVLPDLSTYTIASTDYNLVPADTTAACNNFSGVLRKMTLPTRGMLEWDYVEIKYPSLGDRCRDQFSRTVGVTKRRMRNVDQTLHGEWQYTWLHPNPGTQCGVGTPWGEMTHVAVSPLGHKTESLFSVEVSTGPLAVNQVHEYGLPFSRVPTTQGGRFLSKRIYDNVGTPEVPAYDLVRSEYVTYELDSLASPPQTGDNSKRNARLAGTRTLYHDDGNTFADTALSDFDGVGHYRTVATNGNFAAGNVRTEMTDFNPSRGTYPGSYVPIPPAEKWVLGTFASKTVAEGAPSVSLKSEYVFEPDTGFLACVRTWADQDDQPARATNDLLAIFGRQANGNLNLERYYGGDVQSLPTGSICTLNSANPTLPAAPPSGTGSPQYELSHGYSFAQLATTQYNGANFLSVNQQIDPATGLVKRSCDVSGVCTDFVYDSSGRLTRADHATDTHVLYSYSPASGSGRAQVSIAERNNAQTVTLKTSRLIFDDFGRLYDDRATLPDGSEGIKRTFYEAEGWPASVSEAFEPGTTATWNRYQTYDPFGRPRRIRPADVIANGPGADHTHDIDMTYSGVQSVKRTTSIATTQGSTPDAREEDVDRFEIFDRQGRLYRVQEPANTNGSLATTTYSYDPAGRLTNVSQATLDGTQTRTFTYDGRGFPARETHPEKDPVGVVEVEYSLYDARGHATRKLDGGVRLGYEYDFAERLTKVTERDAGWGFVRDLKVFTYGTANSGINKAHGKLVSATRHNSVDLGTPTVPEVHTGTIIETYKYEGQGGRLSDKRTQFFIDGSATTDDYNQRFFYDQQGHVSSLEYPKCAGCGVPAGTKTVSFGYAQGLLTSVPGYASGLTYHPSGLVDTITHTNSTRDVQVNDPKNLFRPASIKTETTATTPVTLWNTGTYAFDGTGNIAQMGSSYFLYDKVSRLKKGFLYTNPLGTSLDKNQAYTFDGFGNIKDVTTQVGAATPVVRATPTSNTTNRLTGATSYDARGNLTSWNGATYRYGPFNKMFRMTNGGEDWIYIYNADDERMIALRLPLSNRFNRWTLRGLGNEVLREYYQIGEPLVWSLGNDYIYCSGSLLAADTPSGVRHFHLDHLGTPRLVTNSGGAQVAFHAYYPFGEEATAFNQDAERMKFTGHERDLNSTGGAGDDLDYMHARFHSPLTGRLMSVDPAAGSADQHLPQTWNRYAYVQGNPINFEDPTGKFAVGLAWTAYNLCNTYGLCSNEIIHIRAAMPSPDIVSVLGPALGIILYSETAAIRDGVPHIAQAAWNTLTADPPVDCFTFADGQVMCAQRLEAGMPMGPGRGLAKAARALAQGGKGLTSNWKYAVKALGVDPKKAKAAIHAAKEAARRGPAANVLFDTKNGNIILPETGEIIGTLFDVY